MSAVQEQLFSRDAYWDSVKDETKWVLPPKDPELMDRFQKMIESIRRAPWKVVDVETTGLTPASEPVAVTRKELRFQADPRLRLRVISVLWPEGDRIRVESFDLDSLDECVQPHLFPDSKIWGNAVASACLTNVFIAHNAGFDLYWLRNREGRKTKPSKVLDTMLIARILAPKLPIGMIKLATDETVDAPIIQYFQDWVKQERSGWSLADISAALLRVVMPKHLQKPKNWVKYYLTNDHYRYAVDDVIRTYQVLAVLLRLAPKFIPVSLESPPLPILEAYDRECKKHPEMVRQEPQVWDLIPIREKGMPIDAEQVKIFVANQMQVVREAAEKVVALEPKLEPFKEALANWNQGASQQLVAALGKAFLQRGLRVKTTAKTGTFQIGEKDLRLVGAQNSEEAKALYTAWVELSKAKKTGKMALDVLAFSARSGDGRVHTLLGHGPATGRLSSAEPNVQQFPSLEAFRAIVSERLAGRATKTVCAVDYSALDMRVGAALAIRAQREIAEAEQSGMYYGQAIPEKLWVLIQKIYGMWRFDAGIGNRVAGTNPWDLGPSRKLPVYYRQAQEAYLGYLRQMQEQQAIRDEVPQEKRKEFWEKYRELQQKITMSRFAYRLCEVLIKAAENGSTDWSALRETFEMGLDVHTSTTLRMQGDDPKKLFQGLTGEALAKKQSEVKHQLDKKRKGGKVANLGLLYYMQSAGFRDYAASLFNIHWSLDEAETIRNNWLNSYPEVDLWATWTLLNPVEQVPFPDKTRRVGFRVESVYRAETLGGRVMYPLGLNAGLAYGDQGTGADILGDVVHTLATGHPRLYHSAINQVHDEMVFALDPSNATEDAATLGRIMDDCANRFLMPYGVPSACTPAIGEVWLKD